MRAAGHEDDALPRTTQHHPEQAAFVLQARAVAIRLGDEPVERGEVEHRLGPGQAREVPLHGADDDHGVELAADGPCAVSTCTASASRRSHAEKPGPRSPASTRREERLDRGIGGRARFRDRARRTRRRSRARAATRRRRRLRRPGGASTAARATGSRTCRAPNGPRLPRHDRGRLEPPPPARLPARSDRR